MVLDRAHHDDRSRLPRWMWWVAAGNSFRLGAVACVMRWWIVVVTLLVSSRAWATSDGGRSAELVALAGPKERFAVIASSSMQDICPGVGCEVFVVDSSRPTSKRFHRRELTECDVPLLDCFRRWLPPAFDRALAPWKAVDAARMRELAAEPTSTAHRIDLRLGKSDLLRVELATLGRFLSRRASYADATCGTWNAAPTCSSCHEVRGRWVCPGKGTTPEGRSCDCSAVGVVQAPRVVRTSTGATVLGNRFEVEPKDLLPNEVTDPTDALDLVHQPFTPDSLSPSVRAIVTESAILIVGNAAHARTGNGRYFPVVAAFPRRLAPRALWAKAT